MCGVLRGIYNTGWSPAEAQLFFVAPKNRGSRFHGGFRQHVVQDNNLDDRFGAYGSAYRIKVTHVADRAQSWCDRIEMKETYLVFSAIANDNEQRPMFQSDPVLNLNTNPIVDLLSERGHFCAAESKIQVCMSAMTHVLLET